MAWKNEISVRVFNIDAEQAGKFYVVARQYCKFGDIVKETREDGRVRYRVNIKHKNMNRLWHDVEIMKICGVDIKGGA